MKDYCPCNKFNWCHRFLLNIGENHSGIIQQYTLQVFIDPTLDILVYELFNADISFSMLLCVYVFGSYFIVDSKRQISHSYMNFIINHFS